MHLRRDWNKMFNKFENRLELTAELKAETALYIGAGQDSFEPLAVQGCLMKDRAGLPYIPGSSLKGVLRGFLESVADTCERGACSENLGLQKKEERDEKIEELKNGLAEKELEGKGASAKVRVDGNGDELLARYIEKESCIACRLFGSGIMAGKVKISDATLSEPEKWLGTDLRTGNAIDRDTHTTVDGALFDTETIPPGTTFKFRIIAENLSNAVDGHASHSEDISEADCLGQILAYFAQGGISVGGRSRAGLGGVSAEYKSGKVSRMEAGRYAPEVKPFKEEDLRAEKLAETLVNACAKQAGSTEAAGREGDNV
jgi:CRISPR-associated RAMP protein (TIGR02581 family)